MPTPVATGMAVVGAALVILALRATGRRVARWSRRALRATGSACASFGRAMGPRPRDVVWTDLDSGVAFESDRWEVLEHSLRRVGMLDGEAFPALMGMAVARELDGGRRRLFMCRFRHADSIHTELRTETTGEHILRRHVVVKVQGEVLSDMTFDPYYTPVVFDTRREDDIRGGAAHLLDAAEGVLTVSVTDLVPQSSGAAREHSRDVLRVSLRGYRAAEDRLHARGLAVWEVSSHRHSPPEFGSGLDPQTIDDGMRRLVDFPTYEEWRQQMGIYFKG